MRTSRFSVSRDDAPTSTAGATDRANAGLGLGLAIVRQLVELHGGAVSASSDGEGKGATFTVELSLVDRYDDGHAACEPRPVPGDVLRSALTQPPHGGCR